MTNDLSGTRTHELIRIIDENNIKTFLEVGVYQGGNLLPIAKKFPGLKCYGVDPYSVSAYKEYYKENLTESEHYDKTFEEISIKVKELKNITIIIKTSEEAVKEFLDLSFDVIFIDARHDYKSVLNVINLWLPKVKVGGTLSGHDYSINYFGVIKAVNESIGYDNILVKSDSTWFHNKIK